MILRLSVSSQFLSLCLIASGFLSSAAPMSAANISWTNWSSGVAGNAGSASGTLAPGMSITYSGQTLGLVSNTPSWTPVSTFTGGSVGNAPPQSFNSVGLSGGVAAPNTLNFSTPITNPILAIWSLGTSSNRSSFVFTTAEPFTLECGGQSTEYTGSSLVAAGNTVYGNEGNGVIQFNGTYSGLTWTNPTYENFYTFTLGAATAAPEAPSIVNTLLGCCFLMLLWPIGSRVARKLSLT